MHISLLCYFRLNTWLKYLSFIVAMWTMHVQAVYIRVYTTSDNGGIAFTGNTLGLNKTDNQNQPGVSGAIGAFITTDTTSKVGNFPNGTTLNWTLNRSTAVLDLPPDSTVLHAELIWGGSYGYDPTITGAVLNTPVTLITPDSVPHTVTPNPATAQSRVQAGNTGFYVRSADVTSLVTAGGTYTAGGIPATVIATDNTYNCAGWTLAVAYRNPNMLTSNLSLFVGCEASGAAPAVVSGFRAPDDGTVASRLFVSCLEGEAQITGDRFLVGPTATLSYPTNALSGTNNPINNFFASQINTLLTLVTDSSTGKLVAVNSGLLDQRGSFGTLNANASSGIASSGGRQGYDITSIDLGNRIANGQTQLYAQGTTTGDVYTVNALGIQIQVSAPIIVAQKQVNATTAQLGDVLSYTINLSNIGASSAINTIFRDILPSGVTLIPSSFQVNGTPIANPDLINGVPLGTIAINQSVTITFNATVTQSYPPLSYENAATIDYQFVPFVGQNPIALTAQTNTVTVTTPVVPPPVANPDSAITAANTPLVGSSVLTNDTGTSISLLNYDTMTAQGGSVVMQTEGTYLYTPLDGFSGIDTFTYTITDPIGLTSTGTVTITVLPVAFNNVATVAANTTLNQTRSILLNDLGTNLVVSNYTPTSTRGGTVIVQPNGTYTYEPALNYSGVDTFSYTATDSAGNSTSSTVTITVLPVAANDVGTTPANRLLEGSTVFTNDVGTGVTLISYDSTSVQGGAIVMNTTDGTYTYQPPLNYSGVDTFTYTVRDSNGVVSTATVTITVLPTVANNTASTNANTLLIQTTSVINNDVGTNLSISSYGNVSIQGGNVTMQPNGTYTYQPPLNFSGSDAFTYRVVDANGSISSAASVLLTVLPTATNDTGTTIANNPLNGSSVLINDAGTDLAVVDYQSTSAQGGTVVMQPDGTYIYQPPANFSGTDTFTYTLRDQNANTAQATVTITVLPLANNETNTTFANTPLNGPSVLTNDAGVGLTIDSFTAISVQGGTVSVQPNGTYTYLPPLNFSGDDSFTYVVRDPLGNLATGTVFIQVFPLINNPQFSIAANAPLTGQNLLNNAVGTGLRAVAFQGFSQRGGSVTINPDGSFVYIPPANVTGIDSFSYSIVDAAGNVTQGTVTIFIAATDVLGPQNFVGKLEKIKFLNKTEYRLSASWSASASPDIAFYRLYNRGQLVRVFAAGSPLSFSLCCSSKREAYGYALTAVSSSGIESSPITLRIEYD